MDGAEEEERRPGCRRTVVDLKYQILATKTKMLGKQLFFGCMCGRFGALMGPPMVGNGRYANPR